jgi:hypothetical protein
MSIRMAMQGITPAQYELLVAGGRFTNEGTVGRRDERLDKTWRVLYHLLVDGETDNPPRAAKAITGDVLIADEDLPYPPPFGEILETFTFSDGSQEQLPVAGMGALSAELVGRIAADLASIDDEELRRRAARVPVPDVYGGLIHPDDVDNYVLQFHSLREFYESSASVGAAVILWVG